MAVAVAAAMRAKLGDVGMDYDVTGWWSEEGIAPYGGNPNSQVLAEWRTLDLESIELLCLAGNGIQLNSSGYPMRFAFAQHIILPLLNDERITVFDPKFVVGGIPNIYGHGVILHKERIAAVPEGHLIYIDAMDGS